MEKELSVGMVKTTWRRRHSDNLEGIVFRPGSAGSQQKRRNPDESSTNLEINENKALIQQGRTKIERDLLSA
jgi:hypothetical protein